MKLQPLGDRVILKPISKQEKTDSGIVLPDTSNERPEQAEVVAVGPGREQESGGKTSIDVEEGDKVLFKQIGPEKVEINREEFLIASFDDILAKLS